MNSIPLDVSPVQKKVVATLPPHADSPEIDTRIAEVTARRDEFDQLGHVPRDLIATMKRAGVFRSSTPRRFGGEGLGALIWTARNFSRTEWVSVGIIALGILGYLFDRVPCVATRKLLARYL